MKPEDFLRYDRDENLIIIEPDVKSYKNVEIKLDTYRSYNICQAGPVYPNQAYTKRMKLVYDLIDSGYDFNRLRDPSYERNSIDNQI